MLIRKTQLKRPASALAAGVACAIALSLATGPAFAESESQTDNPAEMKQSPVRAGAAQTGQSVPAGVAKQATARSTAKPTIQAAAPDAHRKQIAATRAQPNAQASQTARTPLDRKAVQTSRSSPSWWDWLFSE